MNLISLLLRTRSGFSSDLTFYAFIGVFVGLERFTAGSSSEASSRKSLTHLHLKLGPGDLQEAF
ncbi:MAG: hypothetical protein V1722_01870 [Candidatus Micrarchaeota archaeon]